MEAVKKIFTTPQIKPLRLRLLPNHKSELISIIKWYYFSKQVKQSSAAKPVLLIAGWRQRTPKGGMPKTGIVLQHLPTACPELNPVERFFEDNCVKKWATKSMIALKPW